MGLGHERGLWLMSFENSQGSHLTQNPCIHWSVQDFLLVPGGLSLPSTRYSPTELSGEYLGVGFLAPLDASDFLLLS